MCLFITILQEMFNAMTVSNNTIQNFKSKTKSVARKQRFKQVMGGKQAEGRFPVICLPKIGTHFEKPKIKPMKFLCPFEMTIGGLQMSISQNLKIKYDKHLNSDKSLLLVAGVQSHYPVISESISEVYAKYKDNEDGFLYVVYYPESTFG